MDKAKLLSSVTWKPESRSPSHDPDLWTPFYEFRQPIPQQYTRLQFQLGEVYGCSVSLTSADGYELSLSELDIYGMGESR